MRDSKIYIKNFMGYSSYHKDEKGENNAKTHDEQMFVCYTIIVLI